ncbi:MAG TPA: Rieske 2Fe-2S domain-containing protein, partial [Chloroflexota bacterium]|nr:Rieske 2Fe-2S domain-containing protein [Chloroflexota bacterium]
GHPVVLAVVAGRVYAADGRCPHRGALLTGGQLEAGAVRCPLHGFRYDLRTGESVWPPGWEALPTYPTRVADGVVYVWVGWEPVWPPAARAADGRLLQQELKPSAAQIHSEGGPPWPTSAG